MVVDFVDFESLALRHCERIQISSETWNFSGQKASIVGFTQVPAHTGHSAWRGS